MSKKLGRKCYLLCFSEEAMLNAANLFSKTWISKKNFSTSLSVVDLSYRSYCITTVILFTLETLPCTYIFSCTSISFNSSISMWKQLFHFPWHSLHFSYFIFSTSTHIYSAYVIGKISHFINISEVYFNLKHKEFIFLTPNKQQRNHLRDHVDMICKKINYFLFFQSFQACDWFQESKIKFYWWYLTQLVIVSNAQLSDTNYTIFPQ